MKRKNLYHRDILTVGQFSIDDLTEIMRTAGEMKRVVSVQGGSHLLSGKIMTALFYEPSSRTFGSFITSMQRLGGGIIPLQGVTYSSVSKGETLSDTVRTFACYSDVIVIRHPEVGSARIAAEFSDKPVINAGDGVGEHPTQALLDVYTILDRFKSVSGLTVTLVGDLLNGRTVHSLVRLLSLYRKVTMNLVSPEMLRIPRQLTELLSGQKLVFREMEALDDVLSQTDVLYVTRVQKERFTDLDVYERLKHRYIITAEVMERLKGDAIVMHPFPRVGEIALEVDLDPRAVYIREQMVNGMYVRMALLALVLSEKT